MTTSVMQAQATGLPAITTRHSAFPDQIKDGQNGFLVDEGDFEALAEKILYYMDHPEIWPKMGEFGRKLMLEKYDANALINKQISFYQAVLKL